MDNSSASISNNSLPVAMRADLIGPTAATSVSEPDIGHQIAVTKEIRLPATGHQEGIKLSNKWKSNFDNSSYLVHKLCERSVPGLLGILSVSN
jgi:hypothetical protein